MFFKKEVPVSTDEQKIDELLSRSVVEVIPSKESLKKLLLSGKRLRIKLGIDPTSPDIHIGRAVALLKMRDFEALGHQVVSIVGDFTGVIGDTSDKDAERPMLTDETIGTNKQKYFEQAGKILDAKRAELRYNSEWLSKLGYHEIGEQANQFSVAEFINRELIKKRLDEGRRVSLRETLYPLMQGYDSVAIKADVEIGGTDQRFNMLAGRTLQEHYGQEPQHVLIIGPLIPGTDGRKMSSSWGNTINLSDSANDMFGKIMSIPDEVTETYLTHCTRVPMEKVKEIVSGHPKEAKAALAEEITRMYHSEETARKARSEFDATFSKKEAPTDATECMVEEGKTLGDALVACGSVESKTDFKRLVRNGAIRVVGTDEKVTDLDAVPENGTILRVGKHRFVKIVRQ